MWSPTKTYEALRGPWPQSARISWGAVSDNSDLGKERGSFLCLFEEVTENELKWGSWPTLPRSTLKCSLEHHGQMHSISNKDLQLFSWYFAQYLHTFKRKHSYFSRWSLWCCETCLKRVSIVAHPFCLKYPETWPQRFLLRSQLKMVASAQGHTVGWSSTVAVLLWVRLHISFLCFS